MQSANPTRYGKYLKRLRLCDGIEIPTFIYYNGRIFILFFEDTFLWQW